MLQISWTHHVTNAIVLQRLNNDKEVISVVKTRKMSYFRHIIRAEKYRLLQVILQDKIEGKRGPETNMLIKKISDSGANKHL